MKTIKIWVVTLVLIVVTYFLIHFRSVFSLFFIALAVAYILNPAVRFIQNRFPKRFLKSDRMRKMCRIIAVLIVLLVVFILLFICLSALRNKIVYQLVAFLEELPQITAGFQRLLANLETDLLQLDIPTSIVQPISDFIAGFDGYIGSLAISVLASLAEFTTHVFDVILIVILLVYFMLDGDKIIQNLHTFLISHQLNRISQLIHNANGMIWGYIQSRVLISAGMAITMYLGLTLGNVRYASLFAVMSFLLDFIPYFGSLFGGVIITIFSLITHDLSFAIKVAIFVLILQQVEGNIVVPKIQGAQINVHPLWILLAILLCNVIWGPVGMLIAVPLAGFCKNIFMLILEFLLSPSGDVREFLKKTSDEDPPEMGEEKSKEEMKEKEESSFRSYSQRILKKIRTNQKRENRNENKSE